MAEKKGGGTQPVSLGSLWFGAWLFTIGWLNLSFWKAALAVVVWPYYVGVALR